MKQPLTGTLAGLTVVVALVAWVGPSTSKAAGTWIADAALPSMRHRGQIYRSPWLKPRPTTPLAGRAITRVHWRYGYDRPGKPGTRAVLCAADRCVDASVHRGQSRGFSGLPIATPFRLTLKAPGSARIAPPLRNGHIRLLVDFE